MSNGYKGCHFIYFPASNTIYLDGPGGGSNWIGSSAVGAGGSSLTNSYCTIHAGAAASQVSTEPWTVNLNLAIEFPSSASSSARKHIYSIVGDYQNRLSRNGVWTYWGWWATP